MPANGNPSRGLMASAAFPSWKLGQKSVLGVSFHSCSDPVKIPADTSSFHPQAVPELLWLILVHSPEPGLPGRLRPEARTEFLLLERQWQKGFRPSTSAPLPEHPHELKMHFSGPEACCYTCRSFKLQQLGIYHAFSCLAQANLRVIVHFPACAGFVWFVFLSYLLADCLDLAWAFFT